MPAPAGQEAARLYGVAAAGPRRAWAVGEQGINGATVGTPIALVWDGTAWTRTDLSHLAYTGALRNVAAVDASRAWAVGTDSKGRDQLLGWDGANWRETAFPGRGESGTRLLDIAAGRDGQVWAVGEHGGRAALLGLHGRTWRWCPPLPDAPRPTPYGVTVAASGDVWVYGDVIARWDGTWTVVPFLPGLRATVSGLLAVAHDDVWITGHAYGVGGPPGKPPSVKLEHWDGTRWSGVKAPFGVGLLSGIVGDADGRPDRITGWDFWDQKRAHYLRWDGAAWVSERGPETPRTYLPTALTPIPGAPGEYWSVGTTSFDPYPPAQVRVERYA
ncbi:hypothetical protein [Streptomyces sp. G45]|uniref:hypothetical protein n=1 Tax=Streptomyces sp. G45 TaxID=3406627 RepID=UPI003C1C372E